MKSKQPLQNDEYTKILVENKKLKETISQNNSTISSLNKEVNDFENEEDELIPWDEDKENMAVKWLNLLKYHYLIYYFFIFKLKRIEGTWSWVLIVLAAISTTISAFQFHDDYEQVELATKITIIAVTFITTLIAAWIKKQGYIEKVAELDKYLLKIKKMIEHLEVDIRLPRDIRMSFDLFIKKYKESIIEFNHTAPLISPDDWKETVYNITMYYPEKALEIYPWDTYPEFSENIIDNYKYIKYNSVFKKIFRCYYCSSKCCRGKYSEKDYREYTKNLYKTKGIYKTHDHITELLNPKIELDLPDNNTDILNETNTSSENVTIQISPRACKSPRKKKMSECIL